jgi:hypothetical protein
MPNDFLKGFIAMGYLIAASFFLKFWRESRDRLFVFFSIAFALLAFRHPLMALFGDDRENFLSLYLVRLLAYLVILAGIIDKNFRRS